MLYAIKKWKANWVGHILRGNCRLKAPLWRERQKGE